MKLFGTRLFEDHTSASDMLQRPLAERVTLQAWSAQSVGRTRTHMEDAAFALSMQLYLPERPVTLGIYMVADGMGGHDNGEVASKIAIQGVAIPASRLALLQNPNPVARALVGYTYK